MRTRKTELLAYCGKHRRLARKTIRAFLLFKGHTESSVAADLGISIQAVSFVVCGDGHSPRILKALRKHGVPELYLFDPARVRVTT